MEKIITIGDKEVTLNNNAAWTMEYKDQFGKDIVPALLPVIGSVSEALASVFAESGEKTVGVKELSEAIEGRAMDILLPMFQVEFVDVIIHVTWALAKCADEDIPEPKRWIRQFDTFPLDIIVPEVYELIMAGFTSSKNFKRLETMTEKLKTLQPLHSTK